MDVTSQHQESAENFVDTASSAATPNLNNATFWRVEGSLLNLTAVRPVAFFTWNAQSFLERWGRRGTMLALAAARPVLYLTNRTMATRLLHAVLRGVSRDRLDLLGEEYFEYQLKPALKAAGVDALKNTQSSGAQIVLVSQGLDHVMIPLAKHLGVNFLACNRLDFRDGFATGRLRAPVIRPRGPLARFTGGAPDGRVPLARLLKNLGFTKHPEKLARAIRPAERVTAKIPVRVVTFGSNGDWRPLSVREALRGKKILVIGATGFIGKVWLANILADVPDTARIYVLVRRNRSTPAKERFYKTVSNSPVFENLATKFGPRFREMLEQRIEVVEGDLTKPMLGADDAIVARLAREVDLVINSSGLTDFNPDLRDALSANVESVAHLLASLRKTDHAALLHLSTCYATGEHDGRITEQLTANYIPKRNRAFDAEQEWLSLQELIRQTEAKADSPAVLDELRKTALSKRASARTLEGAALENQIRKNRTRWIRQALMDAGTQRARELGWPNTYTFTKSLAESLIVKRGAGLPIAIVRPSIVESSLDKPFRGWNEGVNTSASLSYLLGTYFRQLPTNERKCLDLIPVDEVTRGMTLIGAALVERRHEPLYQLATSVTNPCNMRRSIELTSLGHRKFYRTQEGFHHWLRSRFDAIPVSKNRYEKLSAPAQKAILQAIHRGASSMGLNTAPLTKRERELERVIKLIALFEPFILHNDHTFEAMNIEKLSAMLPENEKRDFGYDCRSIDWWDYWINLHIPALRKWCYPLIEGRAGEMGDGGETPSGNGSAQGAANESAPAAAS